MFLGEGVPVGLQLASNQSVDEFVFTSLNVLDGENA